MNGHVRSASKADMTAIISIYKQGLSQAFGAHFSIDQHSIEHFFCDKLTQSDPIFKTWVSVDAAGVINGWVSLGPCRNNPISVRKMAEVSVYCKPCSSTGLAAFRLIKHCLAHIRKMQLVCILAFVDSSNRPMQKILKHIGARVQGIIDQGANSLIIYSYASGSWKLDSVNRNIHQSNDNSNKNHR